MTSRYLKNRHNFYKTFGREVSEIILIMIILIFNFLFGNKKNNLLKTVYLYFLFLFLETLLHKCFQLNLFKIKKIFRNDR